MDAQNKRASSGQHRDETVAALEGVYVFCVNHDDAVIPGFSAYPPARFAALRRSYHPPGYDHLGEKKDPGAQDLRAEEPKTGEDYAALYPDIGDHGEPSQTPSGTTAGSEGATPSTASLGAGGVGVSEGARGALAMVRKGLAAGAWGESQEVQRYKLPVNWKNVVSTLCLRTNFEPAELADLFQTFRQLAGERM